MTKRNKGKLHNFFSAGIPTGKKTINLKGKSKGKSKGKEKTGETQTWKGETIFDDRTEAGVGIMIKNDLIRNFIYYLYVCLNNKSTFK